jgi:hypothetical protein
VVLSTVVSVSSAVVILMKNEYLEALLETYILHFFNTECYDQILKVAVQGPDFDPPLIHTYIHTYDQITSTWS